MEKDLDTVLLLDIYGALLTQKQQRLCDMYYNQDYSLAEIATIEQTTRQAARDGIAKARQKLRLLEDSLGVCTKRAQTMKAVGAAAAGQQSAQNALEQVEKIWEA